MMLLRRHARNTTAALHPPPGRRSTRTVPQSALTVAGQLRNSQLSSVDAGHRNRRRGGCSEEAVDEIDRVVPGPVSSPLENSAPLGSRKLGGPAIVDEQVQHDRSRQDHAYDPPAAGEICARTLCRRFLGLMQSWAVSSKLASIFSAESTSLSRSTDRSVWGIVRAVSAAMSASLTSRYPGTRLRPFASPILASR